MAKLENTRQLFEKTKKKIRDFFKKENEHEKSRPEEERQDMSLEAIMALSDEERLKLPILTIVNLIKSLEKDEDKIKAIDHYGISDYELFEIVKTFSDEGKKMLLRENKYHFREYNPISLRPDDRCMLLSTMEVAALIDFWNEQDPIWKEYDIRPYQIISQMDSKKQLEWMKKSEEMLISMRSKKTNISNTKTRS